MWRIALVIAGLLVTAVPASGAAAGPSLHFTVFARTGLPLSQVRWDGREFLYISENTGQIAAADADGGNQRPFATFVPGGEETRCVPAPAHFWPAGIYCHTPDNRILRIGETGTPVTQLARLPLPGPSDGALAFDTTGRFGYALLAATGSSSSDGGLVYAVHRNGTSTAVGPYPGPGGADELVIAPRRFGRASGRLLLAIDQDGVSGRVLAMDRNGALVRVAARLGNGVNPIAVVAASPATRRPGAPAAGLYLADTTSQHVFFASAADFGGWVGSVIVGTEKTGMFWLIRPNGKGFAAVPVHTDLPVTSYNLEGAAYVP
jgi:hypothetical protein